MSPLARWRDWLRQPSALPVRRGLLAASAVLLILSLGAPWKRAAAIGEGGVLYTPMFQVVTPMDFEGGSVTSPANPTALVPDWSRSWVTIVPGAGGRGVAGTAHPVRVPIAVSGVLGFLAVRRRSRRLMAGALTAAAVGLVVASAGDLMSPGWILFAVAAALAAVAAELIPSPTSHNRARFLDDAT